MMSRPSAAQIERALRLLENEGHSGSSSEERSAAAAQVYDKLNAHLSPLLGPEGVRALFARSVKLSKPEIACLAELGGFDGAEKLRACLQALDPQAATEAAAVLFGAFLDLITMFIGDRLTVQLLRKAWPTIE